MRPKPHDNLPHLLAALASIAFLFPPLLAFAQAGGTDRLRNAGNEARFRVIQRFPEKGESADPVDIPQWPLGQKAKRAIEREDWKAAWKHLSGTKVTRDHGEGVVFAYGYVAYRVDEFQRALAVLSSLAQRRGKLVDYANLYAALSAHQLKRYDEAAARAAKVSADSRLHAESVLAMAKALDEGGDATRAIRALRAYLAAHPSRSGAPEARLLLGRLLVSQGETAAGARRLAEVRRLHPLSSERADADAELKKLSGKLPAKLHGELTKQRPDDVLTEFRARFEAHQSEDVIKGLTAAMKSWKKGSAQRCEALYLIAKSHTKLRRHTDGGPWYRKIIDQCPSKYRLKAFYLGGKGYWNAGARDDAIRYFEKIWTTFDEHSFADDAMYFASRIHREEDRGEAARKLLARQVDRYPSGDMAKDAHWLLVRDYFEEKRYDDVVTYVDGLEETGEDDVYSRGRLHYFRARALQLSGKRDASKKAYRAVVDAHPMSYYAFLAFQRFVALGEGGGRSASNDVCAANGSPCDGLPAASSPPISVPDAIREHPAFERGKLLLVGALHDFARREFASLEAGLSETHEQWALAYLLDAARAYPLSHDIPRRRIDDWKDGYPDRRDARRWKIAFPRPFHDDVQKWAKKRKLPEALIFAIMREESGFSPSIESWAGARGLMQLMPSTAKKVARDDGYANFSTDDLYQASVGVRLGSAYLAELAGHVDRHPALIIAGYNGGYGNLSRWLKEPDTNDLDLWVEDIPYGQTRKYTKRVLGTFWVYSWLYGEDRVPRLSMRTPDPT